MALTSGTGTTGENIIRRRRRVCRRLESATAFLRGCESRQEKPVTTSRSERPYNEQCTAPDPMRPGAAVSLLAVGFYAAASACGAPGQHDARLDVAPVVKREMQGAWRWARSSGGPLGAEVTTQSSELRYTLEFMPGQRYREASSEGVFTGTYSITRGGTFDRPSASVAVIESNRPLFNAYFNPGREYAVEVRGDTLTLTEASDHAWMHVYLRTVQGESAPRATP